MASEAAHEREYENARRGIKRAYNVDPPVWADLTDEQRAGVRAANQELWDEMNKIAASISA